MYAFGVGRVETFESSTVRVVYVLLALGAVISLLASLASSRLFTRIGGGMSLAGLLLFLWQLPAILLQANYQSISPLWRSLGWGWHLSMLGTALILVGAFLREPVVESAHNQDIQNNQPVENPYCLQEELA